MQDSILADAFSTHKNFYTKDTFPGNKPGRCVVILGGVGSLIPVPPVNHHAAMLREEESHTLQSS